MDACNKPSITLDGTCNTCMHKDICKIESNKEELTEKVKEILKGDNNLFKIIIQCYYFKKQEPTIKPRKEITK